MAKAQIVVDDDLEDDLELEDEDDEESAPPQKRVRVAIEEEDDLDEDEDDEEEDEAPAASRPRPVAKPVAPVRTEPLDEDVTDQEFDVEAKKRKDTQTVDNYLQRKRDEETLSVDEITELMMAGDQDAIVKALYPYCSDNLGIKKAKQLLREGRDCAKARITRVSGIAGVILDELKSENEDERARIVTDT